MEVIPAIDLKGGKCVRLYQGDYSQETVFSEDPVGIARHWQSSGAPKLHLVDLDGAARGELCHLAIINEIVQKMRIPLQVGGGIRQLETIEQLLAIGVVRVILGTTAVENPQLVKEACHSFGEAIIVGIDARDGYVCTQGWQKRTNIRAAELAQKMAVLGVRRFIYTDIARDGTLTQPNFKAIAELVSKTDLPIIASGGVVSISHLKRLNRLGVEGVIIGRALYTGDIKLDEALEAIGKTTFKGDGKRC
ncbi:MAG TPA: 1-(5-phosphoribosyl)-5-[(5-phosphoribosylamino)methylideneamino]imidazole-4-carboxamide isomerase [Dehalococcoidia bacterium]|nr:1-(5-phosphoribosyl)-5-[(5-phosphoribosylamino)methylideneamino]imidazole-4-carboxamide isomerase [Dehalococcoidia bacterium]